MSSTHNILPGSPLYWLQHMSSLLQLMYCLYFSGVRPVTVSGFASSVLLVINQTKTKARFQSKRNRLRCVRCVRCIWMETGLNASVYFGKQPIMVATDSTEHPIGCCLQPIGCSVEAVATMIGCLPTQALAFSLVSIQTQRTQRTQRKRMRLDWNRALRNINAAGKTFDTQHGRLVGRARGADPWNS